MKNARALAVLVSAGLIAGCTSVRKESSASGATGSKLTGAVSEEKFKALHVLRTDSPPPPLGEMTQVAGSRAYLSLPSGAKPGGPALVVIHEWWGLNDNVMHWADRFAADGYAALAVDLYDGTVATTRDEAMAAMKGVDAARSREILLAAHRFLKEDPRVRARKRGSIGWCFGGGKSLELALAAPDLDAAVVYYGHVPGDPAALESLRAPLLGIFATRDTSIPPSAVAAFDEALNAARKQHVIHSYDADHAFANPSSGRYDEKSAAAAWEQVRAFLAKHLKSAG